MRPAVFLDRDGVINRALVRDGRPYAPLRLEDFELIAEAISALQALKRAGYLLVVATNQPEVARGKLPITVLEAMHARMRAAVPLDAVKVCCEEDGPDCRCYKPKPGMLLDAAAELGIDLSSSYMIGDRWRDVGAGRAAGCRTIFIDYEYQEQRPEAPDATVGGIAEAAALILEGRL